MYQRLHPPLPKGHYEISMKSNWSCDSHAKYPPFGIVTWAVDHTNCDNSTTTGRYNVPKIRTFDIDRCCRDSKTFSFETLIESNCLDLMIFRLPSENQLSIKDIEIYPQRQTLSYIVFQRVESGEDIGFLVLLLLTSPLNLVIFYHFHAAFKKKFVKLFKFKK